MSEHQQGCVLNSAGRSQGLRSGREGRQEVWVARVKGWEGGQAGGGGCSRRTRIARHLQKGVKHAQGLSPYIFQST